MDITNINNGTPLITNDAVTFGILALILGLVFHSSSLQQFKGFYKIVPALLLCYFLPSIASTFGLIASNWIDVEDTVKQLMANGDQIYYSTDSFREVMISKYIPSSTHDLMVNGPSMHFPSIIKMANNLYASSIEIGDFESLKTYIADNNIKESVYSPFIGKSQLYFIASRYLLPASLVLLTISISLKEIFKLGPKALIMFFTATIGVVIGGPLAILFFKFVAPDLLTSVEGTEVWRGLSTVAGSWIGGGANQTAMKELYEVNDSMFSIMAVVDVLVAEVWMVFLLLGVANAKKIDKFFKADSSAVTNLKNKMSEFSQKTARVASFNDLIVILAIAFGVTGLGHLIGDSVGPWIKENAPGLIDFGLASAFFWLIIVATTVGVFLSFTKIKNYEGAGASKIGSVFIYILVATIGMKMNLQAIYENAGFFAIGAVWMLVHVGLLFLVAKLIKAPFFFLAVGSKANIGGAASAPVIAGAFHPSLAPVGVLLAVLGYALGTYGAILCAVMMKWVS